MKKILIHFFFVLFSVNLCAASLSNKVRAAFAASRVLAQNCGVRFKSYKFKNRQFKNNSFAESIAIGGSAAAGFGTGLYINNHHEEIRLAAKNLHQYCAIKYAISDYSINLMWINRSLNKDQLYIYPAKDAQEFEEKFLKPVVNWAVLNPRSAMHVWYDSTLTSASAIENTKNLIDEYAKKNSLSVKIIFKDVRKLSRVGNNQEVFSDKTPVYFRADLLRVIAAYESVCNKKRACFVYADLDVEPMSMLDLLDKETISNLKKYGVVMSEGGNHGYENGFQITSGHNKKLLESLEWTIIDLNIKRAYSALGGEFYKYNGRLDCDGPMRPLQQIVYDSYPIMFKYFYHLNGMGILLKPDGKVYNKQNDGLCPFSVKQSTNFWAFDLKKTLVKCNELGQYWVPAKKVNVPPASLNYD
jgi:hypothetical protein